MHEYLLAFHRIPKCTNVRLFKIWQGSGSFEKAWKEGTLADFTRWGIEPDAAREIIDQRNTVNPDAELARLQKTEATLVAWNDPAYPVLLKEITDPPFLLYVLGDAEVLNTLCLAVVGTRTISTYGKQVVEKFIPSLVQAGLTIVSGLALGIDAYAHRMTVKSKGKTIAVLGSGIDCLYPVENAKLAKEIVQTGGAIISEFPLGMAPTGYSFPLRNRIISGLSKGTLVVEAKEKSGALITAKQAFSDQNRSVFAVPGSIFAANTGGTHNLIKANAAMLVTSAQDILEELNLKNGIAGDLSENRKILLDTPEEEKLYLLLSKEPQQGDDIIRASGFSSAQTNTLLTMLEMKGLAEKVGGGMWVRR